MDQDVIARLQQRLGRLHAQLRLGLEADHEAQVFGQGINYFHFENLPWSHFVIRACLTVTGLYGRGRRNATNITVRSNYITSRKIPSSFAGFSILQLSDLHVELSMKAMDRLHGILPSIAYDICVLTGDYRGQSFGPYQAAIDAMASLCRLIKKPMYGVLGNHDTIRMLPALEEMGIRMLLNECVTIGRGSHRIHLAGVDDAHFYRADNLERAASDIPANEFSILLSHTPEIYQQAAHAEFDVLLSGHTHGGQVDWPGLGRPALGRRTRHLAAGLYRYRNTTIYVNKGVGFGFRFRFGVRPEVAVFTLRPA